MGKLAVDARWWGGLSEDERRQARTEAERYESLGEAERDGLWNQGAESIEGEAESHAG